MWLKKVERKFIHKKNQCRNSKSVEICFRFAQLSSVLFFRRIHILTITRLSRLFQYHIMSKVLTFVTGNAKKLEEIKAILGVNFPYELRSEKIDLPGE